MPQPPSGGHKEDKNQEGQCYCSLVDVKPAEVHPYDKRDAESRNKVMCDNPACNLHLNWLPILDLALS